MPARRGKLSQRAIAAAVRIIEASGAPVVVVDRLALAMEGAVEFLRDAGTEKEWRLALDAAVSRIWFELGRISPPEVASERREALRAFVEAVARGWRNGRKRPRRIQREMDAAVFDVLGAVPIAEAARLLMETEPGLTYSAARRRVRVAAQAKGLVLPDGRQKGPFRGGNEHFIPLSVHFAAHNIPGRPLLQTNGATMPRKRNEPLPPPPDLPPGAWATPTEAALIRRVSLSTLWNHVRRGIVPPPVYFGPRSPRWRVADLVRGAARSDAA